MKKILFYLTFALVAGTTLFSCKKENETAIPEQREEVFTLTFSSEKPDLIDSRTRTVYQDGSIQWAAGDKIRVGIKVGETWMAAAGEPESGKFPKLYVSNELATGGATAQFEVPGNFTLSTTGAYQFYGLYPSSVTSTSSADAKTLPNVSITIPDSQTPTATSFDSNADVMFAVSESYPNGIPQDRVISLTWNRVVAHADITLTRLPTFAEDETLSLIEFYAQEDADLAGSHLINITDGTITGDNGATSKNRIAIVPTNVAVDNTNHTLQFWFSSLPFTASSIKIVLTTNKKTYTKEYTGITREFVKNCHNTLTIGMKNAVEQDVIQPGQVIPNGNYVIAYINDSYRVMMLSDDLINSNGSPDAGARAYDNLPNVSADGKVHTDENAVWAFQYKSNGKYSIQSVKTESFLIGSGSATSLSLGTEGSTFDGAYDEDTQTYTLTVGSGTNTRGIGFNIGSSPKRFGMYKGDDQRPITLTLIPAVSALRCKTPVISYEEPTVTITCATTGASIYYTTDGSTPTVSSTLYEGAFDLSETATVKAIAILDGYEDSDITEKECTVTPLLTIAQVIAASSGSSVRTSGIVAQVNLKGFIITDGTDNMFVYQNATPSVELGQSVVVSGTRGINSSVCQISGNPQVTPGETGHDVIRTTLTYVTHDNATDYETSEYVSLSGKLTTSNGYYNISISDSSVKGSLYQVSANDSFTGGSLSSLLDKDVVVTGYVTGSTNSYLYIAPVDIIEDPNVPSISISPTTSNSSPASWPADNDDEKTFTITAINGSWAITDDSSVDSWATITPDATNNTIKVKPIAKQSSAAHSGSIVVTLTPSHNGYSNKTATIYLSQAKYSSGGETYTLTASQAAGSAYQYNVNTVTETDGSIWRLFGYGKNNSNWQLGGNKAPTGSEAEKCSYILTPECSKDITTITINCSGSNYVAIYSVDASTLLTGMVKKPTSTLGDLVFDLPDGYTQVKIMFTSKSTGALSPGTNAACYINSVTVTTE